MSIRAQKLYKEVPPPNGFIFPAPVDDPADIFKVGAKYQTRWFQSEIAVPKGTLSWIDKDIFRPYAERLSVSLTAAGYPAQFVEVNSRYVINGRGLENPPLRVILPTCQPLTLREVLLQLERRLKKGQEDDALHWVEYLQSNLPVAIRTALKNCPKLKLLLED